MTKIEKNLNAKTRVIRHAKRLMSFKVHPHLGLASGFFLVLIAIPSLLSAQPTPTPLTRVHAHNDYEHERPLLDALDHGFCSVEADIYLVDGQLLVAHMRKQVKPERTLEKLYLDPLQQRVKKNRGRVYQGGPEIVLLIDIKTDWKSTYPVLRERLIKYADMLTTFRGDTTETNAVRAIITGNRSKEMFAGEPIRYAAYDGELGDLDSDASASLIPWISSDWSQSFRWKGTGPIPPGEKEKLKTIVDRAHARGRRVRFWGSPDFPAFWGVLLAADVDLINTDDLEGAQRFLLHR